MGTLYRFACESCAYEADVSGGRDAGFVARTETMVCRTCHDVVDVLVGESVEGMLEDADQHLNRCPKCRSHHVETWTGQRCPRCGLAMKKGDVTLLWD
jgi:Zn finger protein HypA/HybF involved in hydrogenase expression